MNLPIVQNRTDPFLDLIRLLRPGATLWGGLEGWGRWGLSFPNRGEVLFCWIERGECLLTRPHSEPVHLRADDFVLIRSSTPFALASDPTVEPEAIETAIAPAGSAKRRLGQGTEFRVSLVGGRFVFDTANEDLLTGLLPSLVHVAAGDSSSWRVRSLMKLNQTESQQPGAGSQFITTRLMELILVEILRLHPEGVNHGPGGLLAGMDDPVTAQALTAIHGNPSQEWTVSSLAERCGVSRSSFATRFHQVVGTSPIEYLLNWRMAIAKDQLRQGTLSITEIAFLVGFQSSSAFSTAFTRAVGSSPKRFAVLSRGSKPPSDAHRTEVAHRAQPAP